MPGLISVPSSGSFENKENIGSRMGHANKVFIGRFLWFCAILTYHNSSFLRGVNFLFALNANFSVYGLDNRVANRLSNEVSHTLHGGNPIKVI